MGDSPPSEPEAPAETEATERPQLLRKVAQLTKVVMHLTAKNTQSEEQYEEMEKELEEEVTLGLFEKRKEGNLGGESCCSHIGTEVAFPRQSFACIYD